MRSRKIIKDDLNFFINSCESINGFVVDGKNFKFDSQLTKGEILVILKSKKGIYKSMVVVDITDKLIMAVEHLLKNKRSKK